MSKRPIALAVALLSSACLGGRPGHDPGGGDGGGGGGDDGWIDQGTFDLGADDPSGGGGGGTADTFTPVDDPTEQDRIGQDMWRVLTSAQCWEATTNVMQQYQFHGDLQFRYSGFDTQAGTIGVYAIGWYGDRPAAVLSTWTEEPEGLVVPDETTIVHAVTHIDGSLIVTTYVASTRCM